jgi:two-component system, NarL family, nitrate/nitrite response regulator NarL
MFQVASMESPSRRGDTESVPTRILIVDDNTDFLRAARQLLDRDGVTVAAVATNADEAMGLARDLEPDVVLVDIDLGDESGFDLARRLHDAFNGQTRVLMISTHSEDDFADLIGQSPALGFISKSSLSAVAIRDMLSG